MKLDHGGQPLKRPKGAPTPCQSCPKVPDWAKSAGLPVPELRKSADDMSEENREAYRAYKRMKATGRFPEDELVEWYAGLIRDAEDRFARYLAEKQTAAVTALTTVLASRHGP